MRVDHGSENNDVCDVMELLQGQGRDLLTETPVCTTGASNVCG